MILLDEANLSPMEYYWSDFMNICDDLGEESKINLGEDYVFGIPETLHFLATINNDHTTDTLSPRLIDRAWVISLPEPGQNGKASRPEDIRSIARTIAWPSLKEAFVPSKNCELPPDIQEKYDSVCKDLKKRFTVNPRVENAIRQYWAAASQWFEDEGDVKAAVVALDYAVAQRILPKITGDGEEFETWLMEFKNICSDNRLIKSAEIIQRIIDRGNEQMKYYQFFS